MKILSLATVALFGAANAIMIKQMYASDDEHHYDDDCDSDD